MSIFLEQYSKENQGFPTNFGLLSDLLPLNKTKESLWLGMVLPLSVSSDFLVQNSFSAKKKIYAVLSPPPHPPTQPAFCSPAAGNREPARVNSFSTFCCLSLRITFCVPTPLRSQPEIRYRPHRRRDPGPLSQPSQGMPPASSTSLPNAPAQSYSPHWSAHRPCLSAPTFSPHFL